MGIRIVCSLFLVCNFLLYSCDYFWYSEYHADWIVTEYIESDTNAMNKIYMTNFSINVKRKMADPVAITNKDFKLRHIKEYEIDIYEEGESTFIKFIDHPLFNEPFKIRCLDRKCCNIRLKNENRYFIMRYNEDIDPPYRSTRNCDTK